MEIMALLTGLGIFAFFGLVALAMFIVGIILLVKFVRYGWSMKREAEKRYGPIGSEQYVQSIWTEHDRRAGRVPPSPEGQSPQRGPRSWTPQGWQ